MSREQEADVGERNELGRSYNVPALEKGLDVLEYLADQGIPLTQSQIARALERGPNELFRTLTALDRRGYIRRDPLSGAYSLTLRLYELSRTHSPFEALVRAAAQPMRLLADELRESPHLSVMNNDRLLVLAQAESAALVRMSVAIGGSFPLLSTVSGRVLLAYRPSNEVEALLERLEDYRSWSADQRSAFHERLARIRHYGYDDAYGEIHEGVHDLGVLIGTADTSIQAALAVPSLVRHSGSVAETTLPALRRCADMIARSAGIIV